MTEYILELYESVHAETKLRHTTRPGAGATATDKSDPHQGPKELFDVTTTSATL